MTDPPKTTGWEGADRWFAPSARSTPPAPEPATPPCAVCGAELDPDQTYCLECGSPTPLAPRLRRPKTAYILAGAMVVLGLGAGALAYAVVSDDDSAAAGSTTPTVPLTAPTDTMPFVPLPPETGPLTGPLPPDTTFTVPPDTSGGTVPDTGGFDTVTGPSSIPATTAPDSPTTDVVPPVDPTEPSSSGDWPAGQTAWTAILSSLGNEAAANAAKSKLEGEGEPAGVLYSTDFADLRPGFWVVFSGTYSSRDPAIDQATRLRPQFPGAYAREISG